MDIQAKELDELQQQFSSSLRQYSETEQKNFLEQFIHSLESHEEKQVFVNEDDLKSDWDRIKEYFSIPIIRYSYLLAIVIPIAVFVGFIYIALWVE